MISPVGVHSIEIERGSDPINATNRRLCVAVLLGAFVDLVLIGVAAVKYF